MNNALQAHGRNSVKAIHSLVIRQMKEKAKQGLSEGKILQKERYVSWPGP